jgi:hypothetical protein
VDLGASTASFAAAVVALAPVAFPSVHLGDDAKAEAGFWRFCFGHYYSLEW